MSLYQELHWYLGSLNTPELGVPVLIRLNQATTYYAEKTPYRAVRIDMPGVTGNSLYVTWNELGIPTISDANEKNIFTYKEVYDWTYI